MRFDGIENPWIGIDRDHRVAEKDAAEIAKFNGRCKDPRRRIHDEVLPEPFSGHLESSRVVCLNLNPGFCAADLHFANSALLLEKAQQTFRQELDHPLWFDDITEAGLRHPGCDWWQQRTQTLCKTLNRPPAALKMFVLEYFPYHTERGANFPKLPSDDFRNRLLDWAIDHEKLIVIMRSRARWFGIDALVKTRNGDPIPLGRKLETCGHLLGLSNPRNVAFTPGNIVQLHPAETRSGWERLCAALADGADDDGADAACGQSTSGSPR